MKVRVGCGGALVALLALTAAPAHAQLLPHGAAAEGGAGVQGVCSACHGADGNSVDPKVPKLAGQSAQYLYEQLLAFKAQGGRRASGVMGAMAVNLSDVEMRNTAAYFAEQLPKPTPLGAVVSKKVVARGESIYRQGISSSPAVPACASCHALSGAGLPPEFPRLAGQHAQYLVKQLDEFRSGRRASDPNRLMARVAHKLTDRDIDTVSQYVARLP